MSRLLGQARMHETVNELLADFWSSVHLNRVLIHGSCNSEASLLTLKSLGTSALISKSWPWCIRNYRGHFWSYRKTGRLYETRRAICVHEGIDHLHIFERYRFYGFHFGFNRRSTSARRVAFDSQPSAVIGTVAAIDELIILICT